MKISELQKLLEIAKEDYGDVETVVYDYRSDSPEPVRGVLDIRDRYTYSIVLEVY